MYLRYRFCENIKNAFVDKKIDKNHFEEISDDILNSIADNFIKDTNIDYINDCSIKRLNSRINELLDKINNYDQWLKSKDNILNSILNHQY